MAGRETLTTERSLAFSAPRSQLVGETLLGYCKAGDAAQNAALQWLKLPDFTDRASQESTTLMCSHIEILENKPNVDRIHLGGILLYWNSKKPSIICKHAQEQLQLGNKPF